MMVLALGLLFSLALAAGIGGPVGANAIRNGRQQFQLVEVDRAAAGVLAGWFEESWADSTPGQPAGAVITFSPVGVGGVPVERRLRYVGGNLWLLEVVARRSDQAGRAVAAVRRGWLAGALVPPGDSVAAKWLVSRAAVRGFQ